MENYQYIPFSEIYRKIKCMRTTVCTSCSSSPGLQIGMEHLGTRLNHGEYGEHVALIFQEPQLWFVGVGNYLPSANRLLSCTVPLSRKLTNECEWHAKLHPRIANERVRDTRVKVKHTRVLNCECEHSLSNSRVLALELMSTRTWTGNHKWGRVV